MGCVEVYGYFVIKLGTDGDGGTWILILRQSLFERETITFSLFLPPCMGKRQVLQKMTLRQVTSTSNSEAVEWKLRLRNLWCNNSSTTMMSAGGTTTFLCLHVKAKTLVGRCICTTIFFSFQRLSLPFLLFPFLH